MCWLGRLLTILKASKKVDKVIPCDMQKNISFESFSNTLNTEIKYKRSKNFLRTKSTLKKLHILFFRKLQPITVYFLICYSFMSWSTICSSLWKFEWGFSFLILFCFYWSHSQKKWKDRLEIWAVHINICMLCWNLASSPNHWGSI